ncbi:hypothetical protein JX265_000431 [Neoarthrinium moseri]|uniref:Rhodopsin domain-containing protein n=1 Tax=Neoarthrinium moseri TaxID=1658444 RepID=A0A9P9WZ18_9PEZI|nr:hypothetical protein JX265_000431 [Neoarthrinium moseri]
MSLEENGAPILKVVDVVFVSLAIVSTLLRCYTRLAVVRAFGADDWLMMPAVAMYFLYVYWWLCYIWYDFAMVFTRLSIGIFFLRLTVKRVHLWVIYLVMSTTVAFGFIFFGAALAQCTPVTFFWNKNQDGWCINTKVIVALMYLYSSSSLFSDATYAIFPIFLMKGLQMDRRTKYALIPIMGLGWVASIAVAIRYGFLTALMSPDFTYDALTIAILSSIEQGLAITAGNLATLWPLFRLAACRFGLWDTTIRREDFAPPTIGAIDKAKGREAVRSASVGLAIFTERGDEEREMAEGEGAIEFKSERRETMTHPEDNNSKRNNVWDISREVRNESEERLCTQPSSETLGELDIRAVPVCFLARKGLHSHTRI